MILCGKSIRLRCQSTVLRPHFDPHAHGAEVQYQNPMIEPFVDEKQIINGKSYGLSHAGYDIRVAQFKNEDGELVNSVNMFPGAFILASSVERIEMPLDLIAFVKDKSSWAREGLAVQNTVLEPGWCGFITLELSFHRPKHHIHIRTGEPIAQIIFHKLDQPVEGYSGKYQNQANEPVEAKYEGAPNGA